MQKGTFVSVWDSGYEVRTSCEFDLEQNIIQNVQSSNENVGFLDSLDREYVEDSEGNEHEVCTECHEHFMKTVMVENEFNSTLLEEQSICVECSRNGG